MTNGEKFKTAEERRDAYDRYVRKYWTPVGEFVWLEMKAEEELLPCPFCGGGARVIETCSYGVDHYFIECMKCFGRTVSKIQQEDAIAAWNRRVK